MGTVDVDSGIWLALEWLLRIGAAQHLQARQMIEHLGERIHDPAVPEHQINANHKVFAGMLAACYLAVGWAESCNYARHHRARRHAPELVAEVTGAPHPWLMCNRYKPGERETIRTLFNANYFRAANEGPAIVPPKEPGWVVRQHDGALVMEQMTWGFPVVLTGKRGQKLKPKPVNNARFDKLDKFWSRWARNPENRCLIPATSYAEAVGPAGAMLTTWLSLRSLPVFAWAGLWAHSEEWGAVYTGVMTDNAPELADIHDRSPVILARDDWETWLTAPLAGLKQFDRPWAASDVAVNATQVPWRLGGEVVAGGVS